MNQICLIIGMISVTWGVRSLPFLVPRLNLSASVLNFLNCVPAAVLAALVAEPILNPVFNAHSLLQPELIAAIICLLLGYFKAPMLAIVVVGMGSFWLLRMWFGV